MTLNIAPKIGNWQPAAAWTRDEVLAASDAVLAKPAGVVIPPVPVSVIAPLRTTASAVRLVTETERPAMLLIVWLPCASCSAEGGLSIIESAVSIIRVELSGARIVRICDYYWCPWVLQSTGATFRDLSSH